MVPTPHSNSFPIFQVCFNWIKAKITIKNPLVEKYYGSKNSGFDTAPYELMLVASHENQHIKLLWIYNVFLFSPQNILKISKEYEKLIETVCKDFELNINSVLNFEHQTN